MDSNALGAPFTAQERTLGAKAALGLLLWNVALLIGLTIWALAV